MSVLAQRLDWWWASTHLKFVTHHKQTISDFLQHPIWRVYSSNFHDPGNATTLTQGKFSGNMKIWQVCRTNHDQNSSYDNSVSESTSKCKGKASLQSQPLHLIESCKPIQCSLHLNWPELHAIFVFRLSDEASWCIPYYSYALLQTPIFMLSQHCRIVTHNEFVIKWRGVCKILWAASWCEWQCMMHSLVILALTTTGID